MAVRRRRGFALLAAVILIAVIAVVATVVTVTISGDNDQDRIERAADVLHRLAAAMDTVNSTTSGSSFAGQINTKYPLMLSQLTHHISIADRWCNSALYTATDVTKWRGPYYHAPIPTTGYNVAPGFFANNTMVRVSATNLAIQMDNVSLADAQDLELVVEKKSTGAGPIVTFALTDPTSVQYHLIFGANRC